MTHGVNNNRRVPCSVSVHHGWHPSNELCSMCGPPVVKAWAPPSALRQHYESLRGYANREAAEQKLLSLSYRSIISEAELEQLFEWVHKSYPV